MPENPNLIYSRLNGDNLTAVRGLARLTPYTYFGPHDASSMTVTGYQTASNLKHFRVNVSELKGKNTPDQRYTGAILDFDSRSLYFGHNNTDPKDSNIVVGEINGGLPEGNTVAGLPVRLQQVHFRAFNPSGISDEFAAYFLVSDPVGGFNAKSSTSYDSELNIDSDYALHGNEGEVNSWTKSTWSEEATEDSRKLESINEFSGRLVIGDPLTVGTNNFYKDGLDPIHDKPLLKPNPKNNTYKMSFDTGTLFVRQKTDYFSKEGYSYQHPMDVVISAKSLFHTGYTSHEEDCTVAETTPFDSVELEFYDQEDDKHEDLFLLTRPDPKKWDVLTSKNGVSWKASEVPIFFNFKVTKIVNEENPDDDNLYYVRGGTIRYNGNDIVFGDKGDLEVANGNYIVAHIQYKSVGVWDKVEIKSVAAIPPDDKDNKHFVIAEITQEDCNNILQYELGDIFRDTTGGGSSGGGGEVLNFSFKVVVSGSQATITHGKATIDNIIVDTSQANNVINITESQVNYVYLKLATSPSASYTPSFVTDHSDAEHDLLKKYDHTNPSVEGFYYYLLAEIQTDGTVIQRQMGDIYDMNLPRIDRWPLQNADGKESYDVLQLDTKANDEAKIVIETLRAQ